MSKKRKRSRRGVPVRRVGARKIDRWLEEAEELLLAKNYAVAMDLCQNVLGATPPRSKRRAEALEYMAYAHVMRKEFEDAYGLLEQASTITPNKAALWYNKAMAALYTSQSGQALLDMERAVALEGRGEMAEEFADKLAFVEDIVRREKELRGPDFTLEQLIEQQELFREGMDFFEAAEWEAAERRFRQVIAMGDCNPQPQGNLGTCLLMQRRFDEAEAAYKRALEIEPDYKLARRHLKNLKKIRESGELPQVATTQPFKDAKISTRFV